ncbi:acetylcholinesterase-like [Amblyomma americanum]
MQNRRRSHARPKKGTAQGQPASKRQSVSGHRPEVRRIPSDSKLGRRIIAPRPLPVEGTEEHQAPTVPVSRMSGSPAALAKQATETPGTQLENRTTGSRKSVRSCNFAKDSAEAGKQATSPSSTSRTSTKTLATPTDHEPAVKLKFDTGPADDEDHKKTGFAALSSSSAGPRRPERRVPTPRGGTPEREGPVASQEQAAPTYRGPTGTHLVTVGVSMMLVVVITVLAMIFMWPRPKTPESKSSSGSVIPEGSSSAPTTFACAPPQQLSVWISGAEIVGTKGRSAKRGSGKKTVRHFFGIPYGTSTSGSRRFNYSEPFDMPGSFSAHQHGPHCFQPLVKPSVNISEDCLTLSIWTPFICQSEEALKTVVVVVSSDWFQKGHASDHEGAWEEIASLDVVVVAINFRLGVFGFLRAAPSENVPANVGFRDIIAALTWIQANIAAFYGDRNAMVALGLGSGGVLLSLDLLSPEFGMKGFFKRLILHGMVAGSLMPRTSVDNMRALASNLNECSGFTLNLTALLVCLRNTNALGLLLASLHMKPLRFVPSLDENVTYGPPSQAAVTPWSAFPMRPMKGVSVLCGYSKEDGRKFLKGVVTESEGVASEADPKTVVGHLTHFFAMRREPEIYEELPENAKGVLSRPGLDGFGDFLADAIYYCPLVDMAIATTANKGEVFVYANAGNESFAPTMNYSEIIAFAKTGEAPWSAFGTAEAVFVIDGNKRDLVNKWRSEQCQWVQQLSRRLQLL